MGFHNQKKQYGFSGVKLREAEVVKEKNIKKQVFITIIVLAVAVLAGSLFVAFKKDLFSFDFIKSAFVFSDKEENENNNEIVENTALVSGAVDNNIVNYNSTETVRLAILANPDLFDYQNQPVLGCDAIVYARVDINKTPKILNATLSTLFNDDFDYGFLPANFISTQKDLDFDYALIENGIAKVFLKGKVGPIESECDQTRIQNQITETAKQFNTVKSVEIYLNGEKFEI